MIIESLINHPLKHIILLIPISNNPFDINLFGNSSSGSFALEDLLDDLLFFNEEGTDDAVADTAGTAGTTVGTADSLGVLAHTVVLGRAKSRDLL